MGLISFIVGVMVGLWLHKYMPSVLYEDKRKNESGHGPHGHSHDAHHATAPEKPAANFATKDEVKKLREEIEQIKKSHLAGEYDSSIDLEQFYQEEIE